MVDEVREALRSQQSDEQRERRKKLVDDRRALMPAAQDLELPSVEEFEALLKNLRKERNNKHYFRKLKNALASGDEYINSFLKTAHALEQLLSVAIRSPEVSCQLEALACLTNLACGNHKATFRVLRAAGPYLVTFLNGGNPLLQEQSAWCLANVAMDCDKCRELMQCQGASHALVKALQSIHPQVVDMAVLALQSYAQYSSDIARDLVTRGLLEHLLPLFERQSAKPDFIAQLGWIVFYVYNSGVMQSEELEHTAKLCHLVANRTVLYSTAPKENAPALTSLLVCLADWSCRWEKLAVAVSRTPGITTTLGCLLNAPFLHLRREALWLMHCLSGALALCNLTDICAATNGIVPLLTPGAACVPQVLTLLQRVATSLPTFRNSLKGNLAVLAQLQQMTPEHQSECQKLLEILQLP
ncbi:transmembrane and coiled-coil domain-containing protein 6 isoform X2 [Amblyomma americanum]